MGPAPGSLRNVISSLSTSFCQRRRRASWDPATPATSNPCDIEVVFERTRERGPYKPPVDPEPSWDPGAAAAFNVKKAHGSGSRKQDRSWFFVQSTIRSQGLFLGRAARARWRSPYPPLAEEEDAAALANEGQGAAGLTGLEASLNNLQVGHSSRIGSDAPPQVPSSGALDAAGMTSDMLPPLSRQHGSASSLHDLPSSRRRSGSHPDLRGLGSLLSSPSGSGQLTGVGAGHSRRRSSEDDVFGAAGGLELGSDRSEAATARHVGMNASSSADSLPHVESRGSVASGIGDLPPGDPPSRTLLIRNIQPTISDEALQATFAVYGDIRTLYTAGKQHGFILVSFFDVRAAYMAITAVKHAQASQQSSLEITYAGAAESLIEKDVNQGTITLFRVGTGITHEQLRQLFSKFGEVRSVRDCPDQPGNCLVEFFDTRHAAAAYQAIDRPGQASALQPQPQAGLQPRSSGGFQGPPQMQQQLGLGPPAGHFQSGRGLRAVQSSHVLDAYASRNSIAEDEEWPKAQSWDSALPPEQLAALIHQNQMGLGQAGQQPSETDLQALLRQAASNPALLQGAPLEQLLQNAASNSVLQTRQLTGGGIGSASTPNLAMHYPSAPGSSPNRIASSNSMDAPPGLGPPPGLSHVPSSNTMPSGPSSGSSNSLTRHQSAQLEAMLRQSQEQSAGLRSMPSRGASYSTGNLAGLYNQMGAQGGGMAGSSSHSGLQGLVNQGPLFAQGQGQLGTGSPSWPGAPLYGQAGPSQQPGPGWDLQSLQHEQVLRAQLELIKGGLDPSIIPQGLGQPPFLPAPLGQAPGLVQPALSRGLAGMRQNSIPGQGPGRQGGLAPLERRPSRGLGREEGTGGRLSRRNSNPAAEAERKATQEKLYALDLERVARGEDPRTTLMIKNIPNKYNQKMLLTTIDESFAGMFDFFYLPIDFKNKCNVGYAFINVVRPEFIIPITRRFDNKKWEKFNSEKVCHISYARIQGKQSLVTHFQNSSLLHEDKRCRPILFESNGDMAGEQEPFSVSGPSARSGARGNQRSPPELHASSSTGRLSG
ncbi:hypothetical protein WJX74_010139 [Apatococcus lobatus]|uniref:RRM domain-containing protein n=1 Tax=Apatococcus lobatus TaxID=904363 RepID=A0AAW1QWA9_9CHLO